MISLKNFVDGFMDSKYLNEYFKLEMKKYKREDGSYMGWDASKVINLKEQLQSYLVEIYDSIADSGEDLDEEKAKETYENIIEEKKLQVNEGY